MGEIANVVGVAAHQGAVLEPHGIDRPDGVGRALAAIDQPEGRLLVRLGDVAADEAVPRQIAEKGGEILRRHVGALTGAFDPKDLEPIAVQHGRARLGHRMTHDAGAAQRGDHAAKLPSARRYANSGKSGKPMTVKWSPSIRSNS